jgi:hypothetical protein
MTSRLRPGLTPRRRVEISGSQPDVDNNNPKLSLSDRFSRAAQWDVAAVRARLHGSKAQTCAPYCNQKVMQPMQ